LKAEFLDHEIKDDLQSPIQAPVLDSFGDVRGLDFFGAGEVGYGAADFEHAVVGTGA
jgi:hypothetical protein